MQNVTFDAVNQFKTKTFRDYNIFRQMVTKMQSAAHGQHSVTRFKDVNVSYSINYDNLK